MTKNFLKMAFFTFGRKQCFYLTYSVREHFEKLTFKKTTKKATLNGCISKSRIKSESKLTFPQILFNSLQSKVVFCTLYPHGYMGGSSNP